MNTILLAMIVSFAAVAPPPAPSTLRLPVLGVTIEVPPGTEWKVTPQKGGDGPDSDMLERTSPSDPSLFILIDRNTSNPVDCASIMTQMQGKGYTIVGSEDRAPDSWHPKMAQKDTVTLACLDTKPGNIDAVTAMSASEDDLQMIKAILDSLAKNLGTAPPSPPPPPPAEMMKLPVLGVSVQLPAGAKWKAETYTDDKGTKYDSLERTSPADPSLAMLLSRSSNSTCDALMRGAPNAGFEVKSAGSLVPSNWDQRIAVSKGSTMACLDLDSGLILAALEAADFTDDSKDSVRALLQSVGTALGK